MNQLRVETNAAMISINVVAFMVKVRLVENKLNKNDGNVMVVKVISQ